MKPFYQFLFALAVPALYLPLEAAGVNAYIQHNLVADTPGVADLTDPNLINPWGIALSATSPFWISDNGTGLATVYSTSTATTITIASLKVTIPPGASDSGSTFGPVSGQLSNSTTVFLIGATKASFLFCTEDGTIAGWASGAAAVIKVDNSSKGAVYKGMALGGTSAAPQLYVANFHAGTVEVYDGNFAPVTLAAGAFNDPKIHLAGFCPAFNIVNISGSLYVAYAKQDSMGMDDVPGAGNGYVDIYDMSGNLKTSLIAGGVLNSPWGMAVAPANFGAFSNMLLVGNFGNGRINVFDPTAGTSLGALQTPTGSTISIGGLWALPVGNGTSRGRCKCSLFHGRFRRRTARIVRQPASRSGAECRQSRGQRGQLPAWDRRIHLDHRRGLQSIVDHATLAGKRCYCVRQTAGLVSTMWSLTVDGKPAYIAHISPVQINALVPADFHAGAGSGHRFTSQTFGKVLPFPPQCKPHAPSVLHYEEQPGAAALHVNSTIVGPTTLYPNNSTPAAPNETISFYVTGFGPGTTTIPDGQVITTPVLITGVTVSIGGTAAVVTYSGLVGPGLYQLNVTIPPGTPNGDATVTASVGGQTTQAGALVSVHN